MSGKFIHKSLILLCISVQVVHAQQPEEMQSMLLDSVAVTEHRRSLQLKQKDGTLVWDMGLMGNLPQILGNADPLHYAQMLPGVQTNNEYQGGIHVQGCDNEHNAITIGGVPVYNVNHLLGFFSTFNASHFPSMSLTESAQQSGFANRLGADLTMQVPDQQPERLQAEASAGLIASQGTLRVPLDTHSALTVSVRASYINWLYSDWLKTDKAQVEYSFHDLNATYVNRLSPKHCIMLDAYSGRDRANFKDGRDTKMDMHERWGNSLGALHWRFTPNGELNMHSTLYVTTYNNRMTTGMMREHYELSSRITDVGLRQQLAWRGWTGGTEVIAHNIRPQTVKSNGNNTLRQHTERTHSLEASLHAGYHLPLFRNVSADLGLRGNLYHISHHTFSSLNPSVRLGYEQGDMRCSLSYALRHQYLFQAGFSDMGLPTEFWFSASEDVLPQYGHCFNAKAEHYLLHRRWQVSLSLYYKRLYHQVEYGGTALDFLSDDYRLENLLLHGDGENYGASLMLSKCTGRLTGWVSYAYGRAKRTYPMDPTGNAYDPNGTRRTYPANHDRPHEVNLVATYTLGRHWSFGTTFVACSGTPFTAPRALYVMNGNIMSLYGEHNSNRLKNYWRMDFSANYRWKGRHRLEQGVNLSVYNLLCHDNDLFHYVRTERNGKVYYRSVGFVTRLLPSVSYFIKL